MKIAIHLDWGRSPSSWKTRQESGEVGPGSPYGYEALEEHYEVSYSVDHPEAKVSTLSRRLLKRVIGFDLIHAWRNRSVLDRACYVVTHTEHEYLAVLVLDLLSGKREPRVLCNSIWMWDRWSRMGALRRQILKPLLARALIHTVLSRENLQIATRALPQNKVVMLPFGLHPLDPLQPMQTERSDVLKVLAPGNDRHRDWVTLGQAVTMVPRIEVRVRSKRSRARRLAHLGVDVRPSNDVTEYRTELSWADVVVIPLENNKHISGITVALEALCVGKQVVVADCGGLRDYLGDSVFYYRVGDAVSLVNAITLAGKTPRAKSGGPSPFSLSASGLTARDHALRHVLILNYIGKGYVPPQVSMFMPVEPTIVGSPDAGT